MKFNKFWRISSLLKISLDLFYNSEFNSEFESQKLDLCGLSFFTFKNGFRIFTSKMKLFLTKMIINSIITRACHSNYIDIKIFHIQVTCSIRITRGLNMKEEYGCMLMQDCQFISFGQI